MFGWSWDSKKSLLNSAQFLHLIAVLITTLVELIRLIIPHISCTYIFWCKMTLKKILKVIFCENLVFKILCDGKDQIWFWRHSPCENMGNCASENVGAAYGYDFPKKQKNSVFHFFLHYKLWVKKDIFNYKIHQKLRVSTAWTLGRIY